MAAASVLPRPRHARVGVRAPQPPRRAPPRPQGTGTGTDLLVHAPHPACRRVHVRALCVASAQATAWGAGQGFGGRPGGARARRRVWLGGRAGVCACARGVVLGAGECAVGTFGPLPRGPAPARSGALAPRPCPSPRSPRACPHLAPGAGRRPACLHPSCRPPVALPLARPATQRPALAQRSPSHGGCRSPVTDRPLPAAGAAMGLWGVRGGSQKAHKKSRLRSRPARPQRSRRPGAAPPRGAVGGLATARPPPRCRGRRCRRVPGPQSA